MKNSIPEKFKHRTPVEIRFVDMDSFGHVNNANYLSYLEQARVKYFDDIMGWKYDWNRQGIILARAELNYIEPVLFRDNISIMTHCSRIGSKSFDLDYLVIKQAEEEVSILAEGKTVMVAFDYEAGQSITVPEKWIDAIKMYEVGA
jgi:acyl-CoA thioester hydrolase